MRRSKNRLVQNHFGQAAMILVALVLASTSAQALVPTIFTEPTFTLVGGREDLRAAQEDLRQYRQREKTEAADYERRDALERQKVLDQMSKDTEARRKVEAESEIHRAEIYRKLGEEQQQKEDRKRVARERAEEDSKASLLQHMAESEKRRREQSEAMDARFAIAKRERAKPENILSQAYANYIGVRRCQASRPGKALVYIDDQEGAAAKAQVKDIEARIMQANPTLDREALWDRATQSDDFMSSISRSDIENGELTEIGQSYCRGALAGIKQQYLNLNPDAVIVKKDF